MKQQEAIRVSNFALKKKSKGWEVFDTEKGSCIFSGKYRECFSFVARKFPCEKSSGIEIRRRAN